MLALISTWFVCQNVILPNINVRLKHENKILAGKMEPPYQYRVLKPLIGRGLQRLFSILTSRRHVQHFVAYTLISFLAFLGSFFLFHFYLKFYFPDYISLIGALLLQVVIPLSVSGYYMEGDFINLFFYILGLTLIQRERDEYLPLVIILGTLNREQFAFIVVWYFIFTITQRKITAQKMGLVLASLLAWLVAFIGIRMFFGFKPSQFTVTLHVANNTSIDNLLWLIIPSWAAEVAGFIVLCILAFKNSNWFYKLSFLSLIIYVGLFFINGNLWELAKFLPAFLIMIPMALQVVTGRFIDQEMQPNTVRT